MLEVVGDELMGHIDDACNMVFENELLILSYTGCTLALTWSPMNNLS